MKKLKPALGYIVVGKNKSKISVDDTVYRSPRIARIWNYKMYTKKAGYEIVKVEIREIKKKP